MSDPRLDQTTSITEIPQVPKQLPELCIMTATLVCVPVSTMARKRLRTLPSHPGLCEPRGLNYQRKARKQTNKQTNKRTRSPVAKTAIIHVQVISCHGGSAPSWLHICILKQPSKVYTHVLTPPRSVQTKYAVTAFLRKQLFRQNCNHIHYYTGIPQNKQPSPSQLHTCTISSVRTVYIITPPLPIEATFSVTTTHNYELRPFQFR